MGTDRFRPRARVPGIAAVAAFALSACTPDRSGEVQQLQGQLAECHAQLERVTGKGGLTPAPLGVKAPVPGVEAQLSAAPVAPSSVPATEARAAAAPVVSVGAAPPPPQEGSPSAAGVQEAIESGFGNDLSSAAIRRMLVPVLEKLVTTGVEGDLGRAPTDLYGWGDELAAKRGALLALVGSDGNRLVSAAENFVKVVQALPPAMQSKLAAEMTGFIGTFDIAFAKYPQYKGILAHHDLWRGSPENGFKDSCAAGGKGALHDQYQKLPGGVKRVIRMLIALEVQGMPLQKVKEAVGKVRVAFGL